MTTRPTLRSLVPEICPQCSGELTFAITTGSIECRRCGYVPRKSGGQRKSTDDVISAAINAPPTARTAPPPARIVERPDFMFSFGWTSTDDVSRWAAAAFDTARDHIERKEWDQALEALHRALENQRDFVAAHLWIAYITDDPEVRRERLETVLAYQPNHVDAQRELMVLRGELTHDEAEALKDPYVQPETLRAGGAVQLETENLRCKQCNSTAMTVDSVTGLVMCGSCGFVDKSAGQGAAGVGTLTQALLKRRSQPVQWVVGEHLLVCESCGAKRTIPARKMAHQCPFCASNHVVERDALESFQQPDGVLPFQVSRSAAKAAITSKLGGWWERVKGVLNDNTLERATLEGVFLPYWVFDAILEVRRTITRDSGGSKYDRHTQSYQHMPAYQSYTLPDAMNNVMVCAVNSPERLLTNRLGKFRVDALRAYSPKLLAKFPAELYEIDFDEASLKAREIIAKHMRSKHGTSSDYGSKVTVFPSVTGMTFQLILMPVWSATLHERDGDMRTALVNGQTGQVVLGKPRKPQYE